MASDFFSLLFKHVLFKEISPLFEILKLAPAGAGRGKKDGIAFEGGTAQMQSLTLGSGSFIDGFEEGLVGVKPGETVDLNLTFPDPYENNPDLAGAEVVFTVKMHYIQTDSKEVPKLTDELVSALTEQHTVQEYEDFILQDLSTTMKENIVWNNLMNESVFHKLPDNAVTYYRKSYINNYKTMAQTYGMDFSSFLSQMMGTTESQFLATAKEYAENAVKADLIIYRIAQEQNLTPTEEQRNAALEDLFETYSAQYNLADIDAMKDYLGEDNTEKLVMHTFIVNYACENAKVK